MRLCPLILGIAFIVVLTMREFYQFFVTDEGLRFYASQPGRLLYVLLLGVAGGMFAFGISRLTRAAQRKLKLTTLGVFMALLVGVVVFFGYVLATSFGTYVETAASVWMVAGLLSAIMATGLLCLEFRRVWQEASSEK